MTRDEFEQKLDKLCQFLEDEEIYLIGDYGGEIYVCPNGEVVGEEFTVWERKWERRTVK